MYLYSSSFYDKNQKNIGLEKKIHEVSLKKGFVNHDN